jgi:hypothetical protein
MKTDLAHSEVPINYKFDGFRCRATPGHDGNSVVDSGVMKPENEPTENESLIV